MKAIKKIVSLVLVATIVLSFTSTVEAKSKFHSVNYYRKQAEKIEKRDGLVVVDTADLTYKAITHRKGTVLIERVIGRVKNNKHDGKVLNNGKNPYNYICYDGWIDCKKGDVILTYVLYDPRDNSDDNILIRWDYKLKK